MTEIQVSEIQKYKLHTDTNTDTHTDIHTDRHTDRHIITMTGPDLGTRPSENVIIYFNMSYLQSCTNTKLSRYRTKKTSHCDMKGEVINSSGNISNNLKNIIFT